MDAAILIGLWRPKMPRPAPPLLPQVNGAYMVAPVGNFVAAVVGPIVDYRYRDVSQAAPCTICFPFSFGVLFLN